MSWRRRPDAPRRTLTGSRWYEARRRVHARDKGTCQMCARIVLKGEWHMDHVTPLSKGGSDNDLDNLQCLCTACHERKSATDRGHRVKQTIGADGWPVDD